jgi:hypothetical protein
MQAGDKVRVKKNAFKWTAWLNGKTGVIQSSGGKMSDGSHSDTLYVVLIDGIDSRLTLIGERNLEKEKS